jgi:hypothetical protein
MEVKKIVEGMTAVEVAEVIDSNFKGIKEETEAKLSELGSKIDKVAECETSDNASALDVVDEKGNVLVEFSNGHIKTKRFDSRQVTSISIEGNTLVIK